MIKLKSSEMADFVKAWRGTIAWKRCGNAEKPKERVTRSETEEKTVPEPRKDGLAVEEERRLRPSLVRRGKKRRKERRRRKKKKKRILSGK